MLQKLEISALRGATEPFVLPFEKGKAITIVYGENGTGKSTLCDAFELLASGKIGSLEGKGLGRTEPYWTSTGKKPADLAVKLTTSKGTWTARLARSKAVIVPDDGRPRAAILRRGQILDMVAARPADRFAAIRPFLDTASVEQSEAALQKLIEEEKHSRETALARLEENRAAVENFWVQAGQPAPEPLTWARKEIQQDTATLERELRRLEQITQDIEALSSEEKRLRECRGDEKIAQQAVADSRKRLADEQAKVSQALADVIDLLTAASGYFHAHDQPGACPLCGSAEKIEGLPERVDGQLQAIRSFSDARSKEDADQRGLLLAENERERQETRFLGAAKHLAGTLAQGDLPRAQRVPPEVMRPALEIVKHENAAASRTAAAELSFEAGQFQDALSATWAELQRKAGFVQALRQAVETYDANYATQQEAERLLPRLEDALKAIREERRRFVDGILKNIAMEVGALYEQIHPGEGLANITLLLDPDKRASLELMSGFPEAAGSPPGAYFSESHLDSLGLCIWLALAEMDDPTNTILLLDDVIASVDEPHVDRVIEMLYGLAPKFRHCIFTTHYRPWREKFRWGWLQNGQCHFVELLPWEHSRGIRHLRSLPPIEELRDLLKAPRPSPQLICASAGVILEAILDFLTELYECPVPRKKGRLTLGDLLPGVSRKLRAALTVEHRVVAPDGTVTYAPCELGSLLDELTHIAQARNVFGAHFNELASMLPECDAVRFAQAVLALADHLVDVDCGWPRSDKSGSYWSNADQTRRLHPLKQPS